MAASIAVLTGCGGGGSGGNQTEFQNDESVVFDASGAYDLRAYEAQESATHYYDEYKGDGVAAPLKESTQIQESITVSGDTIVYIETDASGVSEKVSETVTPTQLISVVEQSDDVLDNTSQVWVRYADIGDVVHASSLNGSYSYEGYSVSFQGTITCVLKAFHDTLSFSPTTANSYTYNDVLEIECTTELDTTMPQNSTPVHSIAIASSYSAKNIGTVGFYDKQCQMLSENGSDYKTDDTQTSCAATPEYYKLLNLEDSGY